MAVVVCMRPGDKQATPPDLVVVTDRIAGREVNRFQFLVLRLWELPASTFLANPGLAALAPFAAGASEATVGEAMRVLEGIEPDARRVELKVALSMLAGNVFPARDWLGRIPVEILMTSPTYQRILLDGERRLFAGQLQERLGTASTGLIARVSSASEETIQQASKAFARIRDDRELLAALEALLPR